MFNVGKGTTHQLLRRGENRVSLDPVVSAEDKSVLRELGQRVAEIGSLPIQQKRKQMWSRLNKLNAAKPMVWINDICWHELDVEGELMLKTSSPFCRQIESDLRQTLYWWNHMPGDMVVGPVIHAPLSVHYTGIGIDIDENTLETDAANTIVSHDYHSQIKDEKDIEKIQKANVSRDESKTETTYQVYKDIFDGVLTVEKRGAPGLNFSLWDDIIRFTDAQEALLNLAMKPEFVHRLVDRLVTVYIDALEQFESLKLLALNNSNVRVGSGAYGYTDELPQQDFDGNHVRTKDLWGCAAAQIFSDVSPQMHEGFALNYEKRWLERFGLTYYGCCEPLHDKIDMLRQISNLRKISVSPWNDFEKIADQIGGDYVFSFKPNPEVLARDTWSPELARSELEQALQIALRHNCNVEIIMKDISTVRYEPQRLWEWTKIADEVTERLAQP